VFLKRSIMIPALLLTALTGRVASADPAPTSSGSDSNVLWQMADAAGLDIPDYKDRVISRSDDPNTVWQSVESDDPHSVDFKDRHMGKSQNSNADWAASETGNPHNPQPRMDAKREPQ